MYIKSTKNNSKRLTQDQGRAQAPVNGLERRSGRDRRQQQLPLLKKLFFIGRRKSVRRSEDRNSIVVFDLYNPSLLIGILLILSLSLIDALLTLILLSRGAKELNLVMQYYINHGTQTFIYVKYGLTALPILIILFAKEAMTNRYRINIGSLFYMFALHKETAVHLCF